MMDKVLKKIIYIIEFILSIFLVKTITDLLIVKKMNGYFALSTTIFSIIFLILFLLTIVYIYKKYKENIEKLFLLIAIPIGIGYAFLINPQTVPDEGSHILKAYDVSKGHFITQIDEEGNSFSTSIKDLENFSYMRFPNYASIKDELKNVTDYSKEIKIICAAQGNSPILYTGTALALAVGRLLKINVFLSIYIGRLFNLIIFLVLGYLSIKKLPFAKTILAIFLCMPMMMQQAASFSADCILNAVIIYYISHLIYLIFKENELTKNDKILLYVLTALVAMFKYIYILVAGILLIRLFKDKKNVKQNIKTIIIMIIVGTIFCIGWFIISSKAKSVSPVFLEYNKVAHVNSSDQISFIKSNFGFFLKTIIKEYYNYGGEYFLEAIGLKLGWLNIDVNIGIIVTYLIILIYSCISENSKYEFNNKEKLWILAILFAISLILFLIMYITFTPVGLERITGIQGRYFTSISILLFLCLIKKDNYITIKNRNEKLIILSFILNILSLITVFMFYIK